MKSINPDDIIKCDISGGSSEERVLMQIRMSNLDISRRGGEARVLLPMI